MHRHLRRLAPLLASATLVLTACTPGNAETRAGPDTPRRSRLWRQPPSWSAAARKTGTSGRGGRNDIGLLRPPGGEPVALAVLTRTEDPEAEPDDALLAEVTTVAVEALGG